MKKITTLLILSLAVSWSMAQTRFLGGDISVLQLYEDYQVSYYDQQGTKINDVLKYLKSEAVGWNALRLRLFVAPSGDSDPQVCQDLDYVVRLAKRIKAEGFSLLLDFHYSDTWADPSAQWTPKAWLSLSDEELQAKIYDYTKACLGRLTDEGAAPDFIQTGNEISYGMCWGQGKSDKDKNVCYSDSPAANWTRFTRLLAQATKACREVCPKAQIIIHTERAGDANFLKLVYNKLADIDYDIIGLSYYPFWHKSLEVLSQSLDMLAADFPDKTVQIVETAYYYQYKPKKESITWDSFAVWPDTPEGQAAFTSALIAELKKHANVNGLYWWFPEENGNGPNNAVLKGWINRGLWNNDTHRALPALYVMKDYLQGSAAINPLIGGQGEVPPPSYYDLQGRQLPFQAKGVCIERRGPVTRKIIQ